MPQLVSEPHVAHCLRAEAVTLGYGDRVIVDSLSTTIPAGKITVIVGANACGKSTLLRGFARLLAPSSGAVLLDERAVNSFSSKEVARIVGLLPQSPTAPDGITVADLVGRGRYPHQGWFRQWTAQDDAIVTEALEATDTLQLADRAVNELSGGQRQRVWLAMCLAQDTDILLLDEPTTFLDLSHQIDVLDLLVDRNHQRGSTIIIVLHDLNLAARYADHLIAMKDGAIVTSGAPASVVTAPNVLEVFGLQSRIVPDPVSGTPLVVPIGRHHPVGIPVHQDSFSAALPTTRMTQKVPS